MADLDKIINNFKEFDAIAQKWSSYTKGRKLKKKTIKKLNEHIDTLKAYFNNTELDNINDRIKNCKNIKELRKQIKDIKSTIKVRKATLKNLKNAEFNTNVNLENLSAEFSKKLNASPEFRKAIPDFVEFVLFRFGNIHDEMVYNRKLDKFIPEYFDDTNIPEHAKGVFTKLIKTARAMYASDKSNNENWIGVHNNGQHGFNYNTSAIIGSDNDLADSMVNYMRATYSERQLGARACFYKLIQTLDFMKRMQDGTLKQQCRKLLNEIQPEQIKGCTEEEIGKMIDKELKDCLYYLTEEDINGHTEKLDRLKTNRAGAKLYRLAMRVMYDTEPSDATKAIMNKIDKGLYGRYKNYCKAVLGQVGNAKGNFMPNSFIDIPLKTIGNLLVKHLLLAKGVADMVVEAAVKYRSPDKWFRIFGSASVGLIGITLLADALLLRVKVNKKSNSNAKV